MEMTQTISVFAAVWFVLQIVGNWLLFRKAGKPGWHSIIPILNIYDEYDICWKGGKGILALLCLIVGMACSKTTEQSIVLLLVGLVASVIFVILNFKESVKLAKAFGKGTGYGIFLFFFDRLGRVILGLGKSEYVGKP